MKNVHLAAVLFLALPAAAQRSWEYRRVLSQAEQDAYTGFVSPTTNATGTIAFVGLRSGMPGEVVGLEEGETRTLYDPTTLPWGFVVPNGLIIADNGDVGIPTLDGFQEKSILVWDESSGSVLQVATHGSLSALLGPNVSVSTWDMNESGQFAIRAFDGPDNDWLLRWTDGVTEVLAHGDGTGPSPWEHVLTPVIDDDGSIYAVVETDATGSELALFPPGSAAQILDLLPGEFPWNVMNAQAGELIYYGREGLEGFLRRRDPSGGITTLAGFGCGQAYVYTQPPVTVSMNAAGDYAFYAATGACDADAHGIFSGPVPEHDTVYLDGSCVNRAITDPYATLFSRDAMDAAGNILLVLSSKAYSPTGLLSFDELVLAVPTEVPGVVTCTGTSPFECPCLNGSGAASGCAQGCANSSAPARQLGAFLEGIGSGSVSTDDMRMRAGGLIPGELAVLFVGAPQAPVLNRPFGDGRLCTSTPHRRLGAMIGDHLGTAEWGPGLMGQGGFVPGQALSFQVWYRDPGSSPCGTGVNLTNGYEIPVVP